MNNIQYTLNMIMHKHSLVLLQIIFITFHINYIKWSKYNTALFKMYNQQGPTV